MVNVPLNYQEVFCILHLLVFYMTILLPSPLIQFLAGIGKLEHTNFLCPTLLSSTYRYRTIGWITKNHHLRPSAHYAPNQYMYLYWYFPDNICTHDQYVPLHCMHLCYVSQHSMFQISTCTNKGPFQTTYVLVTNMFPFIVLIHSAAMSHGPSH